MYDAKREFSSWLSFLVNFIAASQRSRYFSSGARRPVSVALARCPAHGALLISACAPGSAESLRRRRLRTRGEERADRCASLPFPLRLSFHSALGCSARRLFHIIHQRLKLRSAGAVQFSLSLYCICFSRERTFSAQSRQPFTNTRHCSDDYGDFSTIKIMHSDSRPFAPSTQPPRVRYRVLGALSDAI